MRMKMKAFQIQQKYRARLIVNLSIPRHQYKVGYRVIAASNGAAIGTVSDFFLRLS